MTDKEKQLVEEYLYWQKKHHNLSTKVYLASFWKRLKYLFTGNFR